jgi:septum formation protein
LAGFPIRDVIPPNIPEVRQAGERPLDYVRRLAREKANAVHVDGSWVLAADTIVHLDQELFEKPENAMDAHRMLSTLSGNWHKVTSAWCLRWSGPGQSPSGHRKLSGHQTSRVQLRQLQPIEIQRYIATGEGIDKAGGYAVQGAGASLIERVVGSTTAVVGLPLNPVATALIKVGISRETE